MRGLGVSHSAVGSGTQASRRVWVRGPSAAGVAQAAEGGGEWPGGRARVRGLVVWERGGRGKTGKGRGAVPTYVRGQGGQ